MISVTPGYMGGHVDNPSYQTVCGGMTGHAEAVCIVFLEEEISYEELVAWFWKVHDPTSLNGQGEDKGPQYRSAIFYVDKEQEIRAQKSLLEEEKRLQKKIVTAIEQAKIFYPAEISHHDYYANNRNTNPYCQAVITPKLKKLGVE